MNGGASGSHGAFSWGKHAQVLFTGWPGRHGLSVYLLALFLVAAAAAASEFLTKLVRRLSPSPNAGTSHRVLCGVACTAVYALRMGLLYLLMLAVMSFNVGVFIAAVVGHGLGFLVVGSGLVERGRSEGHINIGGSRGYGKL